MITAEEARKLSQNSIWKLQLEQIEQGVKASIIMGGNHIYYKSDKLHPDTIEHLRMLGYNVEPHVSDGWLVNDTKISWEEKCDENK